MNQLITATEFASYRNISKKLDTDKINEAILLAQQSDLLEILGDFYFDVLENSDSSEYSDLMDGTEFEYCDESFRHVGIKRLLADYAYSRFIYMINVNLSAFGAVTKNYQDGDPIERNQVKDLSKQAQVDAGIKFKYIEKYILSEPDLFTRYCSVDNPGTSFNSVRISKL